LSFRVPIAIVFFFYCNLPKTLIEPEVLPMSTFFLTPYSFKIRPKGRLDGYFELDNILDEGKDVCDVLNDYLSNHLSHYETNEISPAPRGGVS
jgi:hypothetical protein